MAKIGAALSGPKLDGKKYEADLSQSSDQGFLAAEMIGKAVFDVMQAYPVNWEQVDPDKLQTLRSTAQATQGGTRGIDFFLIFQLFQMYLALAAQASTAQPGQVIEAPHGVKVTEWGRRFNVTIKATCEAVLGVAGAPGANEGNPEVGKPER